MKSNYFLQLIIFFMCFIFSLGAQAEELTAKEAEIFGQTQGQELLDTFAEKNIEQKYKKLDELFVNYIDLKYISKFVIGKYWRQMDKEQQSQYQNLFVRYAMSVYKGFPLKFDKEDINFQISSTQKDGEYVLVSTDIKYRASDGKQMFFPVELRLHKKNGKILITDIKVAEKSLILSYRTKFYDMVNQADEDMEWFLEDFAILTASSEQFYQSPEPSI